MLYFIAARGNFGRFLDAVIYLKTILADTVIKLMLFAILIILREVLFDPVIQRLGSRVFAVVKNIKDL